MEETEGLDTGAEKCGDTVEAEAAAETAASASASPTTSSSDQPAAAAAPTPTAATVSVSAMPLDLFENPIPINADVPIIPSGENVEIPKEEMIVSEMTCPSTNANAVVNIPDTHPSSDADDLLLHFGESSEGGRDAINNQDHGNFNTNQASDFDLLGFPPIPIEQTVSMSNSDNASLGGLVADPFAPVYSDSNLLEITGNRDATNQEGEGHNAVGVDEGSGTAETDILHHEFENAPNDNEDTSTPVADTLVEQGTIDTDLTNESAPLSASGDDVRGDEGVTVHASIDEMNVSPAEISPVIDEDNAIQPSTTHENTGREEGAIQSSDGENVGVTEEAKELDNSFPAESTAGQTDSNVELVAEETTNDGQARDIDGVDVQPTDKDDTPETSSSGPVGTTPNSPQYSTDNREQVKVNGSVSDAQVNTDAEERTEEEEEWLSMGLGLGDALRQIVALTEERDSSFALCREKDSGKTQAEALLVEVQSRLEAEMNRRAESDSEKRKLRETLKSYEDRLKAYETMEDDLEKANANLVTVVTEKSKIELEVQKLRDMVDESQQKEAVLSNRLNEAKKKEANKSTTAGRLEEENEKLKLDLQATKDELETVSKAKAKLESNMEKLKVKAVERVKQAETALAEERELNEERKKKMKTFVETKADELREAKECASNMQKELEETRASLRSSRDREEASLKELEAARLKHRELQRDMERMVRNSEQLHKAGNSLEQELEKYASETEEHKKKRQSAKHEIMQMVRTLEAERAVSAKLRESVKFTFTPKALSQQELLTECLRDFESELERLAAKTGKSLHPSTEPGGASRDESTAGGASDASDINGSLQKSKKSRATKSDVDTERLISNLEQETQHVSKGIMSLAGDIERMRTLLNDDNAFGCLSYFSNILPRAGEARHQRLGDGSDAHYEKNNSSDRFV